jgi:hypothetical protein
VTFLQSFGEGGFRIAELHDSDMRRSAGLATISAGMDSLKREAGPAVVGIVSARRFALHLAPRVSWQSIRGNHDS